MINLVWFHILVLLWASMISGSLFTMETLYTEGTIRNVQRRSIVKAEIGTEALRKILYRTRLLFSNGYDKVFLKTGGYRQAMLDFKSVDPKVFQDSIQKGELMGSKGNLIIKVYKPDNDAPRMTIEIHKVYKQVPTDPPQKYYIVYNG